MSETSERVTCGYFVKKPIPIKAWKWNETKSLLEELQREGMQFARHEGHADSPDLCRNLEIVTREGCMLAQPGCWIVRGIKGEFYPIDGEIFDESYLPAPTLTEPRGEGRSRMGTGCTQHTEQSVTAQAGSTPAGSTDT